MKFKRIIGIILLSIAVALACYFAVVLNIDWLGWYANSAPFYINVIIRSIEFLLPAIICIITGIVLINKSKNK